ncbi:hypothetical protein BgiMline_003194, partial [Biomphalaria glabrata]
SSVRYLPLLSLVMRANKTKAFREMEKKKTNDNQQQFHACSLLGHRNVTSAGG